MLYKNLHREMMVPPRILLIFLLHVLAVPSALASFNPDNFEVSGMRIGQGVEEIRSKMKQFDKSVSVNEVVWRAEPGIKESMAALEAHVGPLRSGANFGYRLKAAFGQVTKTAYIVMQQAGNAIPNNEKTTYEALKARMTEKFGSPTQEHTRGSASFIWVFKRDGQPDPESQSDNCWNPQLSSDIQDINIQATEGCGVVVAVRYTSVHNNPELIDSYQVVIFDHREAIKNLKEFTLLKDSVEQKRIEDEKDKVKSNKIRI